MHSFRQKVLNSTVWSGIERFSTYIIQFIFNVLIARVLVPADYGIVAMLGIFLAISQCFVDSGFSSAIIRKINRTDVDFSTVFYYNLSVAILLYFILYAFSPIVAEFYNQPLLKSILRVNGLCLIINALSGVQHAKLSISLNFKARAKIALVCAVFSGSVALFFAHRGFGVWTLVIQSLSYSILCCCLLWITVRWIPLKTFSLVSFKELFGFGSKLLLSSLLDTIYNNLYSLVIGKLFSPKSLGLYSRADSLAQFPSITITNAIQNVAYPAMCSIKEDKTTLRAVYVKLLRISVFVVFPMMVGLASVSDSFVSVVLTDKWIDLSPLLKVLCFSLMWFPIQSLNLSILQVEGRSDMFLKLEIYKKILGIITLCITIPLGIMAMCYGRLFCALVSLFLNSYYTKQIISYGLKEQMCDIFHIIIHVAIMYGVVFVASLAVSNSYAKLALGICAGISYYILGAYLMKFPEFYQIISMIKKK